MASTNAQVTLRLQQSRTYHIIGETYRKSWLDHCSRYTDSELERPLDGEVFPDLPLNQISDHIKSRLNRWGLISGQVFTTDNTRFYDELKSIDFRCKFHGKETRNYRKIQDDVVIRDTAGQRTSDRQTAKPHT